MELLERKNKIQEIKNSLIADQTQKKRSVNTKTQQQNLFKMKKRKTYWEKMNKESVTCGNIPNDLMYVYLESRRRRGERGEQKLQLQK